MKRSLHSEPDGGYGYPAKARYRQKKWTAVNRFLKKTTPVQDRRVLLLDTHEFNEVAILLEKGYRAENIVVTNEAWKLAADRAIARRHLFLRIGRSSGAKRIELLGLDYGDAIAQRPRQFDIYDFDGTGVTESAYRIAKLISVHSKPSSVVTMTIWAGQDKEKRFRKLLSSIPRATKGTINHCFDGAGVQSTTVSARNYARFAIILQTLSNPTRDENGCWRHITKHRLGRYKNLNGHPLIWLVCRLDQHTAIPEAELIKGFFRLSAAAPRCACQAVERIRESSPDEYFRLLLSHGKNSDILLMASARSTIEDKLVLIDGVGYPLRQERSMTAFQRGLLMSMLSRVDELVAKDDLSGDEVEMLAAAPRVLAGMCLSAPMTVFETLTDRQCMAIVEVHQRECRV